MGQLTGGYSAPELSMSQHRLSYVVLAILEQRGRAVRILHAALLCLVFVHTRGTEALVPCGYLTDNCCVGRLPGTFELAHRIHRADSRIAGLPSLHSRCCKKTGTHVHIDYYTRKVLRYRKRWQEHNKLDLCHCTNIARFTGIVLLGHR